MDNKKAIIIGLVLVGLAVGGWYYAKNNPEILASFKKLSASQTDAIKAKAEKFINEKMLAPGSDAKITEIVEENGLYKLTVSVQGQNLTAYIDKDGKNFITQVFNMDAAAEVEQGDTAGEVASQPAIRQDVPSVELFVMSYCPYGLQMEKAILPVVEKMGSKINFSLKFVNYAMHGEKEIDENLRQYCIQQQGFSKLDSYLNCFTKKDDSAACLVTARVDKTKLASCVSATDVQFKIKERFNDENQWDNPTYPPFGIYQADNEAYGVTGSPTLVVNGTVVSADRTSQGLLNLVCSGFTSQPEECSQALSGDSPSASFGEGTSTSANAAECSN